MANRKAALTLRSLEQIARRYGAGMAARKRALLAALGDTRGLSSAQLLRLHELLCFLHAYPDDRRIRGQVRRMLLAFHLRADLRRHRDALAGTGIAGTATPYRFFWPTACWIAQQWPGALRLDRDDLDAARAIIDVLPQLLEPVQAEWLRGRRAATLGVLDRLVPRDRTDADFLIGLIVQMPGDDFSREAFGDRLDMSYVLRAGRGTPERTTARIDLAAVRYQTTDLLTGRPDLRAEARRGPLHTRPLRSEDALAVIRLARICMITRERDAAIFQFAHPEDVFLIDDGQGLAFAMMGMLPERRAVLPSTYGALMLKNGVPIGYVQADMLGRHAALSFNVFETFRRSEAARVFARLIAAIRHVFGCDEFSIEPYQLGDGNHEGIVSGAWWFYYRFGFRPRSPAARRLASREVARRRADGAHRSSVRTLRALARSHLFFSLDETRRARLPRIDAWLAEATRRMRRYRQVDPRHRRNAALEDALRRLGPVNAARLTRGQRATLGRWAPLVLAVTARGRWLAGERRQLLQLILAKAGRSERDFQRRLLRHARLRALLDC